jgi:hypothetical protein
LRKWWLIVVIKEREGVNSVVLLAPPPGLSLIGTSYMDLPRPCCAVM